MKKREVLIVFAKKWSRRTWRIVLVFCLWQHLDIVRSDRIKIETSLNSIELIWFPKKTIWETVAIEFGCCYTTKKRGCRGWEKNQLRLSYWIKRGRLLHPTQKALSRFHRTLKDKIILTYKLQIHTCANIKQFGTYEDFDVYERLLLFQITSSPMNFLYK